MSKWVIDINAKLNNHHNGQSQEEQGRRKRSIYKLPPLISDHKKKAYQPQAVSFGPYHYGEPHLESMEDHKQCALLHVLDRSQVSLGTIFDSIVEVAQELKDSYNSLEHEWQDNTEKFVQLMIMDGCFMLELLRVAYKPGNYYSDNDAIFSRHGDLYVVPFIRADMLLLENQLPMSLLVRLRGILENAKPDIEALNKDILCLLNYDISKYSEMGKCLHVLDLYRKGLLHTHYEHINVAPQSLDQREGKFKWVGRNVIRSATELHEAGVHFMKSKSKSLWDITFDGVVLKLPNFIVDDYTESMFLNLLAFERYHIPAGNDITSFIAFMDSIINDSRDVKLLSSKGIIDNFIGSDKEVVDLFCTMSKDLIIDYCNTPWHNCLSKLTEKSCKRELVNGEMDSWVVKMQATTSIYKVHPIISSINKTAYQPRVVSFGPYHHGEPQLASMEAHKKRALLRCIHRSRRTMQEVFNLVEKMAQQLKDSYDFLDSKWQDDTEKFVQLMILDGCFMLELLDVYKNDNYYSDNDPVFSLHGELYVMQFIRVDMLMLENQLPMSLLLKLKHILENAEPDIEDLNKRKRHIGDLNADILWLLSYDIEDLNSNMGECLHVLDLYRKSLLHTPNEHGNVAFQSLDEGKGHSLRKYFDKLDLIFLKRLLRARNKPRDADPQSANHGEGNNRRAGHNVVRPATDLHEAGVRFMKSESKSLRDITFDGGVLKLPNFIVDDYTESMYLNLIAFERCHIPAGSDITSFVAFMDRIIDDRRDIKLLSSKGIINNFIGADKEAADLFNRMSRDLAIEMNLYFDKMYTNLIDYSNTPSNRWRANLNHTYFRSPWAIISIFAAFLLLSLTVVQTIFTIH